MIKPLSDDVIETKWKEVDDAKNIIADTLAESGELDNARAVAQEALRDTLRQVLSLHNMRNVDGVNPEWALSDKEYQELKKQAEEK